MRSVNVNLLAIARVALATVLICEVGLLLLDLVFNYFDIAGDRSIRRIFNVAREQSFPTWFSSTQAFLVAGTAAGITALGWKGGKFWVRAGWVFVTLFFLYVGIDDASEIHERVGSAMGRAFEDSGGTSMEWFPSYSWQLFVAPVLAVCLFVSCLFVAIQTRSMWVRGAVVSCLVCFAVSQGLDFIEGMDHWADIWAAELQVDEYAVAHGQRAIEEYLEMLGTTSIWMALMWEAGIRFAGVNLVFSNADPRGANEDPPT